MMPTTSKVTKQGLQGTKPGRDATVGADIGLGPRSKRRGAETPMVPDATFTSYYGKPILNQPTWKAPDIPGYLFCGGLAGTASVLAAAADVTGRPTLARAAKVGAASAIGLGMAGLVHDLGRPGRFLNMLRVVKITSPMSIGSWLLSAYAPAAAIAATSAVTHRMRPLGAVASAGAALLGPAVASYTGALVSDTAVPAWHDAYREMPFLFVSSGAAAASGLAMVMTPTKEAGPARRAALVAAAADALASKSMERRLGDIARPYKEGKGGTYLRAARMLTTAGALTGVIAGRRSRTMSTLAGAALVAGSWCTKMGVFEAGFDSVRDPAYTVSPQRERLDWREQGAAPSGTSR
jgi:DMSO reductase anchor subunit